MLATHDLDPTPTLNTTLTPTLPDVAMPDLRPAPAAAPGHPHAASQPLPATLGDSDDFPLSLNSDPTFDTCNTAGTGTRAQPHRLLLSPS